MDPSMVERVTRTKEKILQFFAERETKDRDQEDGGGDVLMA
jgi:hypothetical protein